MIRKHAVKQAKDRGIFAESYAFAILDDSVNAWWVNIPRNNVEHHWAILLHDPRIGGSHLHILNIDAGFFSENASQFSLATNNGWEVYALLLSADEKDLFQDVRAGGKTVHFARFLLAAETE